MAAVAADAAFFRVEEKRGIFLRLLSAEHAVVQPGLETLAGGKVKQEPGQQRFPFLVGKGQPGQGVKQQHKKLLLFLLGLRHGFRQVQQPDAAGQPVVVVPQGVEGFNQFDGGYRDVPAVFVQHVIPQREQLAGVQVVGFGLAAVPDDGVNPTPGRGKKGDHPVVVPVVHMPQHNGGIFCLNHGILSVPGLFAGWRIS